MSAPSLSLSPGGSDEIVITVSPQSGTLHLSLSGLPAGLTGSFSPARLTGGQRESVLVVLADPAARYGEATLTIRVSVEGAPHAWATAQLKLFVTDCPGYAIPSDCPPFRTGGGNSITGVIVERSPTGSRPAAGASVWAWVQYQNTYGQNTNGYSAGRVQSDSTGAYRFPNLPVALVVLQVAAPGTDQPCASIVQLDGPTATANLEIVHEAEPIVDAHPSPPALTGVVYEMTANGRRPVAGARVFFEMLFEVVAATTTTDQQGRYSLCRLPSTHSFVTPVKAGYVTTARPVMVSGVVELDLEMKRQ